MRVSTFKLISCTLLVAFSTLLSCSDNSDMYWKQYRNERRIEQITHRLDELQYLEERLALVEREVWGDTLVFDLDARAFITADGDSVPVDSVRFVRFTIVANNAAFQPQRLRSNKRTDKK